LWYNIDMKCYLFSEKTLVFKGSPESADWSDVGDKVGPQEHVVAEAQRCRAKLCEDTGGVILGGVAVRKLPDDVEEAIKEVKLEGKGFLRSKPIPNLYAPEGWTAKKQKMEWRELIASKREILNPNEDKLTVVIVSGASDVNISNVPAYIRASVTANIKGLEERRGQKIDLEFHVINNRGSTTAEVERELKEVLDNAEGAVMPIFAGHGVTKGFETKRPSSRHYLKEKIDTDSPKDKHAYVPYERDPSLDVFEDSISLTETEIKQMILDRPHLNFKIVMLSCFSGSLIHGIEGLENVDFAIASAASTETARVVQPYSDGPSYNGLGFFDAYFFQALAEGRSLGEAFVVADIEVFKSVSGKQNPNAVFKVGEKKKPLKVSKAENERSSKRV
jgi:hypothetical protein